MSWEILVDRGAFPWAQWVDLDAFASWQVRLRALWSLPVSRWSAAEVTTGTWESPEAYVRWGLREPPRASFATVVALRGLERWQSSPAEFRAAQFTYLRDVVECVSSMLRALNQPAPACPAFVNAWRAVYGTMVDGLPFPVGGVWRREAYAAIDRVLPEAARLWEHDGPGYSLDLYPRITLDVSSDVNDRLLRAEGAPPPVTATTGGEGTFFCVAEDSCGFFKGPDWGGAARDGAASLLVSLDWSWEFVTRFVLPLLGASARELVGVSRIYTAARNIIEARAHGGATERDLVRAAARVEEMRASVPQSVEDYGASVREISGALAAVNPIMAAVISGLTYASEGVFALGGTAVAQGADEFGRRRPVLERAQIGGEILRDTQTPPPFTVTRAPPVDVLRYPLTSPRDPAVALEAAFAGDVGGAEVDPEGVTLGEAVRVGWGEAS